MYDTCREGVHANGEPCPIELDRFRRFVDGINRDTDLPDVKTSAALEHMIADAGVMDLLIDRCVRYLAVCGTFYEEVKKTGRMPDEEPSTAKTQVQPLVDQMNRLIERKHKLIEKVMGHDRSEVKSDGSLAELMQAMMEVGKKIVRDAVVADDATEVDEWTMPGLA